MAAKSYPYKQWNVQSTAGGYWEDSSNWKSANSANSKFNNGYVIGELSTAKSKVVKFRSAVNAGSVLLSIGGNGISRSGSDPIVFCADQDDYGITVGNLDVGEWGYGYLAIERGTYVDNGYLYVRNPVNTSDATFRVGGTGEKAMLDVSGWIGIGQDGSYPVFMEIGNGGTVRCLALYPGVAQNKVATLTVTTGGCASRISVSTCRNVSAVMCCPSGLASCMQCGQSMWQRLVSISSIVLFLFRVILLYAVMIDFCHMSHKIIILLHMFHIVANRAARHAVLY